MDGLIFHEENHTYEYNGALLPSVTQLVAPLGEDYDEPNDYLETVIDFAADRGSTLHAYIEWKLNGGERDEFEMPSIYDGYADAVDAFFEEHSLTPYLVETALTDEECAGTVDYVGDLDEKTALLDWKFVSSIAKSKVGAQLAGYYGFCERNGIFPEYLAAVQFLPNGRYRIYEVGLEFGREAFAHCLEIYRLKTMKHPRGRIGKDTAK